MPVPPFVVRDPCALDGRADALPKKSCQSMRVGQASKTIRLPEGERSLPCLAIVTTVIFGKTILEDILQFV